MTAEYFSYLKRNFRKSSVRKDRLHVNKQGGNFIIESAILLSKVPLMVNKCNLIMIRYLLS